MSDLTGHNPYDPPRAPIGILDRSGEGDRPTAPTIGGTPFLTIWIRPRSTIRAIVDARPAHGVIILACLYGLERAFNFLAQLHNIGGFYGLSPWILIGSSVVAGLLGGMSGLYFVGWMVARVGRWLGGRGRAREVRAALAWGSLPYLVTLIQLIASFLAEGRFFLTPSTDLPLSPLLLAYLASSSLFGIWSLVITAKCVGEVHRFSSWKALGSLIVGWVALTALAVIFLLVLAYLPNILKAAAR